MDLEGKSIAMVRDVTNITSIVKDNVVKSTDYCNSGMLFIDLVICGYKPWEKIDWNPNGKPEFVKHPYDKAWWQIAKSTPFFAEIKRSYTKRSFKVSTLAYLKYYAPFVFYTLRAIKRALKGVKVLPK